VFVELDAVEAETVFDFEIAVERVFVGLHQAFGVFVDLRTLL